MHVNLTFGNCLVCNTYGRPVRHYPNEDSNDAICEPCDARWFLSRHPGRKWIPWSVYGTVTLVPETGLASQAVARLIVLSDQKRAS